jgi:hypothetical protein
MKHTLYLLKYSLVIVLLIVFVFAMLIGGLFALLGILGSLVGGNVGFLVLIPVGFIFVLTGSVAVDGATYFIDKWELKA